MKHLFEPLTTTNKDTSRYLTKTMTETSEEHNNTLNNLNDKLLEIIKDRGIMASYLLSPLSKIFNPEHTSQFTLVNDPKRNTVNDLLINKTIPVTLYKNLLTFCATDQKFEF